MSHYNKRASKSRPPTPAGDDADPEDMTAHAAPVTPESPPAAIGSADHQLLETLFQELFQTEASAKWHPQREARRLGEVPPAQALRAVSEHASQILQELPVLARQQALKVGTLGKTMGILLSTMRHWVLDRLIEPERSYRGTLAGMRHGVDLVELIFQVAQVQGRRELQQWCARWLTERRPLVEAVAAELAWFAQSPAEAVGKPGSHRPLRPEPSLSQAQV